jgi:glycosidase
MDRLLNLYEPEITRAQLNLLDSHDVPRFLTCVRGDKDALKLAWLFIFTIPGAPCIYYGDEVGVDGEHDPDCRKGFPWDENRWDKDLLQFVKACIQLRKEHPTLRRGTYKRIVAESEVVAFNRSDENEDITVAFNVATGEKTLKLQFNKAPQVLFGNLTMRDNQVVIPPRSGVVIK